MAHTDHHSHEFLTRDADEAFFAGLDTQRATVLRRRIKWYFITAILIEVLAFAVNLAEVIALPADAALANRDKAAESMAHALTMLALLLLYVPALVFVLRMEPRRPRLVRVLTVVTTVAISIAVVMEAVAGWANTTSWMGENAAATRETTGYQAVNALGMLYCLACVLIPMRLRESLPIVGVCTIVCAATLGLMVSPSPDLALELAALLLGYVVVGTGYSAWRYRMFDFHFRADRLREKYNTLSGEAREISAELSQARRLHEALFPDPAALAKAGTPIAYRYEPMREIGGDFLYVHQEPSAPEGSGGVTLVLIDVSGHGIAAALAVNRLHGELQRFFSHYPTAAGESGRPGHVLMNLNTYACAALSSQGVYATALVARLDPGAAQLEWASAGHPPAFLGTQVATLELPSTAVMLGVVGPELFDSAPQSVPLREGDCLLAYTDGAMEARDSGGTDFGLSRIRDVLERKAATNEVGAVSAALMEAVSKHRSGRPADDTLVVEARAGLLIAGPHIQVRVGMPAQVQ
jgi:serine phosphatase RsbU (regulator of sigma subunit)